MLKPNARFFTSFRIRSIYFHFAAYHSFSFVTHSGSNRLIPQCFYFHFVFAFVSFFFFSQICCCYFWIISSRSQIEWCFFLLLTDSHIITWIIWNVVETKNSCSITQKEHAEHTGEKKKTNDTLWRTTTITTTTTWEWNKIHEMI